MDIDAYDSRHQQRVDRLEGRADREFLQRIRTRLSQLATNAPQPSSANASQATPNAQASAGEEQARRTQSLDDLIVQAEIFMQYSLQAKAVERLQKIAELFPSEEQSNERLRNLCQLANWWPPAMAVAPGSPETAAAGHAQKVGMEGGHAARAAIRVLPSRVPRAAPQTRP